MTLPDITAPDSISDTGDPPPFARLRARSLIGLTLAIFGTLMIAVGVARAAMHPAITINLQVIGLLLFVAIGAPLLIVPRRAGMRWRRLLGPWPTRGELALVLVIVPVVLATFTDVLLLYVPLSYVAPGFVQRMLLDNSFFEVRTLGQWALLMLVGTVMAPVLEELIFRGLLLHRWAHRWGTMRGVLASAVFFALLHGEWPGKILFALAMSLLYLRTGKLWLPILAHALNNFVFLAPTLLAVLRGTPPQRETLASLRAQFPEVLPLLALTIAAFWAYRRYVWGDVSMRALLRGTMPYERPGRPA